MEQGSGRWNAYETISSSVKKLEHSGNTTPLPVEVDSPARNAQVSESLSVAPADHTPQLPLPVVPHVAAEVDGQLPESAYAKPAHCMKPIISVDPSFDDRTQYADVNKFQNPQVQLSAYISSP